MRALVGRSDPVTFFCVNRYRAFPPGRLDNALKPATLRRQFMRGAEAPRKRSKARSPLYRAHAKQVPSHRSILSWPAHFTPRTRGECTRPTGVDSMLL